MSEEILSEKLCCFPFFSNGLLCLFEKILMMITYSDPTVLPVLFNAPRERLTDRASRALVISERYRCALKDWQASWIPCGLYAPLARAVLLHRACTPSVAGLCSNRQAFCCGCPVPWRRRLDLDSLSSVVVLSCSVVGLHQFFFLFLSHQKEFYHLEILNKIYL